MITNSMLIMTRNQHSMYINSVIHTGLCKDFNYIPNGSLKYKIHRLGVDCCCLYFHSHAYTYVSESDKSTIQWET